jgi:hypothetical protein
MFFIGRVLVGLRIPTLARRGSLTSTERAQFNCIFLAFTSHSQNAFHQWRQGHLANELWSCWEALLMNTVHTPGGIAFWRERSYVFAQDFRREVEAMAAREPDPSARAFGVLPLIQKSTVAVAPAPAA